MAIQHEGKYVAYYRVSTQQQGRSGLGLEAQRATVADFMNGGSWALIGEYVEIESGRKGQKDRPQLVAALDRCRAEGATLIVAKLDRLSRDARMLLELVDGGVPVRFVDLPDVDDSATGRFMLTMMVALAELEAKRTGERTKAALQAAKARGVKLGTAGPRNIAATLQARIAIANEHAEKVRDVIAGCQSRGLSQREMARQLNAAKVPAPRGGKWHQQQIQRTIARLAQLAPPKRRGRGRPALTPEQKTSLARAAASATRRKNQRAKRDEVVRVLAAISKARKIIDT